MQAEFKGRCCVSQSSHRRGGENWKEGDDWFTEGGKHIRFVHVMQLCTAKNNAQIK